MQLIYTKLDRHPLHFVGAMSAIFFIKIRVFLSTVIVCTK